MRVCRSSGRSERTSITSQDRKSTRLNSSHSQISYAVFCLNIEFDPGGVGHTGSVDENRMPVGGGGARQQAPPTRLLSAEVQYRQLLGSLCYTRPRNSVLPG